MAQVSAVTESRLNRWVGASAVIYAKTGISEVGLFFHKFSNWYVGRLKIHDNLARQTRFNNLGRQIQLKQVFHAPL